MIILMNMIEDEQSLSKFQKLYNQYKNIMYWVAYDICKNEQDAEDIVEEAFIKVIKILYKIVEDEIDTIRCKNLMITIAKNTAIDFIRKREHEMISTEVVEIEKENKSAEDICIDIENYRELVFCIGLLEEKYRDILRLKILYELNSKEIASILNISEANVNMRFMRAKRMLKEKLEECKNE